MPIIESECAPCRGTGICKDLSIPSGVGLLCPSCSGTRHVPIRYIPFIRRQERGDVKVVRKTMTGSEISYQDFLRGRTPT